MRKSIKLISFYGLLFIALNSPLIASGVQCLDLLSPTEISQQPNTNDGAWFQKVQDHIPVVVQRTKAFAIDKALDVIAYMKGLPKYFKRMESLIESEDYLHYQDFGEMALAEIGISVRVNQEKLQALNTGRALVIVANHPLGFADGFSLQFLTGMVRQDSPSLLMLARWIDKLLPSAVFGDDKGWGTAVPVDISKPDPSDPLYESQISEMKAFNSKWSRITLKALRKGALVSIFPAGQVSGMNLEGESYPNNIQDAEGSWQSGVLNLIRGGKADVVFAHIDSVNSKSFYKNRKRFGGGDKERVIWFFGEALAKKNQAIDIHLSDPLSLDAVYNILSETFDVTEAALRSDDQLAAELMRRLTHDIQSHFPQELNLTESPSRVD